MLHHAAQHTDGGLWHISRVLLSSGIEESSRMCLVFQLLKTNIIFKVWQYIQPELDIKYMWRFVTASTQLKFLLLITKIALTPLQEDFIPFLFLGIHAIQVHALTFSTTGIATIILVCIVALHITLQPSNQHIINVMRNFTLWFVVFTLAPRTHPLARVLPVFQCWGPSVRGSEWPM